MGSGQRHAQARSHCELPNRSHDNHHQPLQKDNSEGQTEGHIQPNNCYKTRKTESKHKWQTAYSWDPASKFKACLQWQANPMGIIDLVDPRLPLLENCLIFKPSVAANSLLGHLDQRVRRAIPCQIGTNSGEHNNSHGSPVIGHALTKNRARLTK